MAVEPETAMSEVSSPLSASLNVHLNVMTSRPVVWVVGYERLLLVKVGAVVSMSTICSFEKPEDPETPPPEIPEENLEFEVPDNAVSMAAPSAGGNLSIGNSGFARDSDYIPVYVPQPQYPRRAQTRGKEGYAVVEVIITTTGGVRDPIMVEEWPEGWGFGRSAIKAANKLKYNPRVIDGQAQEVQGVLYKFTFQMAK